MFGVSRRPEARDGRARSSLYLAKIDLCGKGFDLLDEPCRKRWTGVVSPGQLSSRVAKFQPLTGRGPRRAGRVSARCGSMGGHRAAPLTRVSAHVLK